MLYQLHRFASPILLLVLAYMVYNDVDKHIFLSVVLILVAFDLILYKFFSE